MRDNRVFKQKNLGQQWGIFATLAGQLSIFIAMINLLLLIMTAYNTTLRGWFEYYNIPLNFWSFTGLVVLLLTITAYLLYKFALPSFFSFLNDQGYRHDNPIRKDIERVQKTLDNNLKEVKERLKKLEGRVRK